MKKCSPALALTVAAVTIFSAGYITADIITRVTKCALAARRDYLETHAHKK